MKIIVACVAALALFTGADALKVRAPTPDQQQLTATNDQSGKVTTPTEQKPETEKPVDQQKEGGHHEGGGDDKKPNAHPLWTGHAEKQTAEGQVCFELKAGNIAESATCWLCHDAKMLDESNTPAKPELKDGEHPTCEQAAALVNHGVLQHCAPEVTANVEVKDVAQETKATIPIGPSPCQSPDKATEHKDGPKTDQQKTATDDQQRSPKDDQKPKTGGEEHGEGKDHTKPHHGTKGQNKDEQTDDEEPLATNDLDTADADAQ